MSSTPPDIVAATIPVRKQGLEEPALSKWPALFRQFFIEHAHEGDDLLFFVPTRETEEVELDIYRRHSTTRPVPKIGGSDYLWTETFYLNMLLQYYSYTLVVAVCTRVPGAKKLSVAKRFDQRVYASPSRRRMDVKGSQDEITYPQIYFSIDNFDESFEQVAIDTNQSICVELVAHVGDVHSTVFSGAVTHTALATAFVNNRASKHFQQHRTADKRPMKFLEMKGPKGVGDAEMAVCILQPSSQAMHASQSESAIPPHQASATAASPVSPSSSAPPASPFAKTGSFLKKFSNTAVGMVRSALSASKQDPHESELNAFVTFISLPMPKLLEATLDSPTKPVFPSVSSGANLKSTDVPKGALSPTSSTSSLPAADQTAMQRSMSHDSTSSQPQRHSSLSRSVSVDAGMSSSATHNTSNRGNSSTLPGVPESSF